MPTAHDLQSLNIELSTRLSNYRLLESHFITYCNSLSVPEWDWTTPLSDVANRPHQHTFSAFGLNFLLHFSHNTEFGVITYATEMMDERGAWRWNKSTNISFDSRGNSQVSNLSMNFGNPMDCQFIHQLAVLQAVTPKSS